MVELSDQASIANIRLNGNRHAHHLIYADGNKGPGARYRNVTVRNVIMINTRNSFASGADPICHALIIRNSNHVTVADNAVQNIGYPKLNPQTWNGNCSGMHLRYNNTMTVENNAIINTLTAGIDFTGSVNSVIEDNLVRESSRQTDYVGANPGFHHADGLTAYHNDDYYNPDDPDENESESKNMRNDVLNNRIEHAGWNGMHLSGRDWTITGNTITDTFLSGVRLGDQRTPNDKSTDVTILSNTFSATAQHPGTHNSDVRLGECYDTAPGSIVVQGDADLFPTSPQHIAMWSTCDFSDD